MITAEEEESFRMLAQKPDVYETIAKSIAPSIFGSEDIKKSISCLLFGGSRKRLPDGLTRRGDINVLLLGDPGTAKSQLLKFVERVSDTVLNHIMIYKVPSHSHLVTCLLTIQIAQVSPVSVYTSGKGSSAAGLTASVMRDPSSRNFVVEVNHLQHLKFKF